MYNVIGQYMTLFFTLHLLAADNGRAPHYQRAPRGGWCLRVDHHSPVHRVLGPNHSALEHIDLVVGHGRSDVTLSSNPITIDRVYDSLNYVY